MTLLLNDRNQNHPLNGWFAKALKGLGTTLTPQGVLKSLPTAFDLQQPLKGLFLFALLYRLTRERVC